VTGVIVTNYQHNAIGYALAGAMAALLKEQQSNNFLFWQFGICIHNYFRYAK